VQLLLIVDHQVGLYSLVQDFDATVFRDSVYAHAEIARVFDIPVVMTTSAQDGKSAVVHVIPSGESTED
jgi:nicotinamidase-related amidase